MSMCQRQGDKEGVRKMSFNEWGETKVIKDHYAFKPLIQRKKRGPKGPRNEQSQHKETKTIIEREGKMVSRDVATQRN